MKFIKWAAARLSEPSSWRGIIMLITSIGISVKPELMEPIIVAGTGIAGVIGVVTADK